MEEKIKQVRSMLTEAEKEYAGHSIKEPNGLITPERLYKSMRLHTKIMTLKEVLEALERVQ